MRHALALSDNRRYPRTATDGIVTVPSMSFPQTRNFLLVMAVIALGALVIWKTHDVIARRGDERPCYTLRDVGSPKPPTAWKSCQ